MIAGFEVKILDVDHWPPHCHTFIGSRRVAVELRTLEILDPPPNALPPSLRNGLKERQVELLRVWEEKVHVVPSGAGRRKDK